MDNKQFFNTLNENIEKSTTERALQNLKKAGESYVKNLIKNPNISVKIKNEAKRELKNSKKLMLKIKVTNIKD
jgi:hypothetical protein